MPLARLYLVFAAFYFAQFGILGIYLPYLPLYLESLGISAPRIGVLMALAPVSRFLFPAFWGLWADRMGRRKPIIILSLVGSAASFSLLLWAERFASIGSVIFVYGFLLVPAIPLVEATVQEEAEKRGFTYGRVRLWGSIGFIVLSLGVGRLLDQHPVRLVLWAILGLAVFNVFPGLALPRGHRPPSSTRPSLRGELRRGEVILFLAATTLMHASHGAYYVYYSIHLDHLGFSRTGIGGFWTVAVGAEVLLMLASGPLLQRMGAEKLMSLCLGLAALRWGILMSATSLVSLIFAQTLHAFSFGLFHVSAVGHTHRLFPAALRSSGQSLYSSLTYGLGSLIGFFGSAALLKWLEIPELFGVSSLVALVALSISWRLGRHRR